ncbi:protease FtsH-inhibitory lysogeny factor CIII, partial [Escherichia coli]
SLLERITRKLRDGWKRLIDILNQPGVPKNGSNNYGYPD